MRRICSLLLTLLVMPAAASDLSIERIFSDPALAGSTPRGVKVAPDGRRVGLLRGRATDQHQLDLWTYDVKTGRLEMRVNSAQLVPEEHLSDAERARRERERTADYRGILDYDWAPDGRHVLFTLGGNLYLYDLDAPPSAALRRLTRTAAPLIDPAVARICAPPASTDRIDSESAMRRILVRSAFANSAPLWARKNTPPAAPKVAA